MCSTDLPGFLLFAGSNDRAVLSLCRGFTRYGANFGLIGRGADDLLLRSAYADRFLGMRTSGTLTPTDLHAIINEARRRYGNRKWVICPTSEYLNRHLFEYRDALSANDVELAVCSEALYGQLSDKARFRAYCLDVGLSPPPLMEDADAASLPLPFVAKPSENVSPDDRILYPYLVRTERDRRRFLAEPARSTYYLERYMEGQSWYLLYYMGRSGRWQAGAQRNLLQQGQGKSIVLARMEIYPDSGLVERIAVRLRSDGYRGFIMVELRRNDREVVVIEANPRCWGPFQLALDANTGLLEAFLNDYGYAVPMPESTAEGMHYLWTGGILKALRGGIGIAAHARWTTVAGALVGASTRDVYARPDSRMCYRKDLCQS